MKDHGEPYSQVVVVVVSEVFVGRDDLDPRVRTFTTHYGPNLGLWKFHSLAQTFTPITPP